MPSVILPTLIVYLHGLIGQSAVMTELATTVDKNISGQQSNHFPHPPFICLDEVNHGRNMWTDSLSYPEMAVDAAQQIRTFLEKEENKGKYDKKVILIGHSMGGKTAMKALELFPDLFKAAVILDIGPYDYTNLKKFPVSAKSAEFFKMLATLKPETMTREEFKEYLDKNVYKGNQVKLDFIMKSVVTDPKTGKCKFLFNIQTIANTYSESLLTTFDTNFQPPALIQVAKDSAYIDFNDLDVFSKVFKNYKIEKFDGDHFFFLENVSPSAQSIANFVTETLNKEISPKEITE